MHASPLSQRVSTGIALGCLLCCWAVLTTQQQTHPDSREPAWIDPATTPQSHSIVRWVSVEQLPAPIAVMDSVFWEPDDTTSLRKKIMTAPIVRGASVLEIGTGSGIVALCCLQAGAARVIATDLNPAAVANVRENAGLLKFPERLEARLVPRRAPGAWTVIAAEERFDLIISNPPWENVQPSSVEQFALYDPEFQLLHSLLGGARERLKPGGRMWLAYGCVTAIRTIQQTADRLKLNCQLLDERDLDALPELFLPGMLIEITVP